MDKFINDLIAVPSYPGPMTTLEPGVRMLTDSFFKELIGRIRDIRKDIAMRRIDKQSYVVELVVKHAIGHNDIVTIMHADNSALANKYLRGIRDKIDQYSKSE